MERNLTLSEEKNNIFKRLLDERTKEYKDFKDKMTSGSQGEEELRRIEEKWAPQTEKIKIQKQ